MTDSFYPSDEELEANEGLPSGHISYPDLGDAPRDVARTSLDLAPDPLAEVRRNADRLGLDPEAAFADPRGIAAEVRRRDTAVMLEGNRPALTVARADPDAGTLMLDDREQLERIRNALAIVDDARERWDQQSAFERNLSGPLRRSFAQMLGGLGTAQVLGAVDELQAIEEDPRFPLREVGSDALRRLRGIAPFGERRADIEQDIVTRTSRDLAEGIARRESAAEALADIPVDVGFEQVMASGDVSQVVSAILDEPSRAWRLVVEGFGTTLPSYAVGLLGGPAGGAAASAMVEQAMALDEGLSRRGIDLSGMDEAEVITTLSDPELRSELVTEAQLKSGGIALVDLLSFGLAGRILAPSRVGGRALSATQRQAINVLAQVPVQGLLEGAGEATGQLLAYGEVSPVDVLVETIAGAGMAVSDVGVFGGREALRLYTDQRRAQRVLDEREATSTDTVASLTEAVEAAQETRLVARDPEVLKKYVREAGAEGLERVYVAPEAIAEYAESSGLELQQVLRERSIDPEDFADAQYRGGYVEVEVEPLVVSEDAAEFLRAVADDVKPQYDGVTKREAEELRGLNAAEFQAAVAAMEEPLLQDRGEQVYADVYQQLMDTSRYSETQARNYARLWQSTFSSLAHRSVSSMSADQLYEQFRPDITRGFAGVDQRTMLMIQQLRARANRRANIERLTRQAEEHALGTLTVEDPEALRAELARLQEEERTSFAPGDVNVLGVRLERAGIDPTQGSVRSVLMALEEAEAGGRSFRQVDLGLTRERNEHGDVERVGTRVPGGRDAVDEPASNGNLVRMETALEQAPKWLRTVSDTMVLPYMNVTRRVNGKDLTQIEGYTVRGLDQDAAPEDNIETAIEHWKENLLWLFDQSPPEARDRMSQWYDGAHRVSRTLAERYDLDLRAVVGVLAGLSPQKDWFENVTLAERLIDIHETQGEFVWSDEMTETANRLYSKAADLELVEQAQGMTLNRVLDEKAAALWIRTYDQTYNSQFYRGLAPEGTLDEVVMGAKAPKKLRWQSFAEAAKSVSILRDPSMENIHERLGGQHKVRSFYNNILDPGAEAGDVTIDTHAVAAAHLRPMSSTSREVIVNFGAPRHKGSGLTGMYTMYAEAYHRAAAERGVLPRQMQSITWEMVRTLFTAQFKTHGDTEAVHNAWGDYLDGTAELDQTRERVVELAGGIGQPEWLSRPATEFDGATWGTTYESELPGGGVRGRDGPGRGVRVPGGAERPGPEGAGVRAGRGGELEGAGTEEGGAQGAGREFRQSLTTYPLADRGEWYGDANYQQTGGRMVSMTPDEYLAIVRPIDPDEELTRENIDDLKEHMLSGRTLDPLALYPNGREDGRHRAIAARELGIEQVPVLVWPEDPRSADIAGREFQQTQDDAARGTFFISADRGERIIRLFDNADPSTFLHESAHYFLELYQDLDLSGQLRAEDRQALFDWLGVQGWGGIQTEHHERWAEAFEEYMFAGNPPSEELRRPFRAFADWMRSVYRTARDIGATLHLDPEVTAIFDRMVAAHDEVDSQVAKGPYLPAFQDAGAAGMTESEFERYREVAGRAVEDAREKALRSLMADISRRRTKQRKERLDAARTEAETQLNGSPVWQAMEYLRHGRVLEDPETRVKHTRLDAGAVEDRMGTDALPLLPNITTRRGGQDPDTVAEQFGYRSGVEMLEAIAGLGVMDVDGNVTYPSYRQAVEAQANAIVDQEEGTNLDPARVEAEATEALHNQDRGELLALELRALERLRASTRLRRAAERNVLAGDTESRPRDIEQAELEGLFAESDEERSAALLRRGLASEREDVARVTREQRRAQVRESSRALRLRQQTFRAMAREHVANMEVSNLSRLGRYLQDERKASREAAAAIAAGDYNRASLAKQREMWSHFVYAEAVKAKDAHGVAMRLFKRWQRVRQPNKVGAANEYVTTIQTILSAHNVEPLRQEPEVARANMPVVASFVDARNAEGDQIVVPDSVYNARHIDTISVRELDALKGAVRSLSKNGNDHSEARREEERRRVEELTAGLGGKPRQDREELGRVRGGARDFTDHVMLSHRKAEHLFMELDNFEDLGPMWRAMFKPINDAANAEATMREEAAAQFKDIWRRLDDLKTTDRTRRYAVGSLRLTREELLSIGLNWGNVGNREALLNGSRRWTEDQLLDAINTLSDEEWTLIEDVWRFIDGYWPAIAELERRTTGVAPEKVRADPFQLRDGRVISGGYYPIKFDPKLSPASTRDIMQEQAKQLQGGSFSRAATRHGHSEERKGSKGSEKRVWLSVDTMFRHVDDVIHDLTHREAVNEVYRLLNNREMQAELASRYGVQVGAYLNRWLQNVAAGSINPVNMSDIIMRHLRVGMSMAEMGLSLRTMIVQPFGITQTVARIGPTATLRGMASFVGHTGGNPFGRVSYVNDKSAYMTERGKVFDRDIAQAVRRLDPGNKLDRMRDASFWLISKTDMMVSYSSWLAQYDAAIEAGRTESEAVDLADQLVRTTQGSGLAKDLADIQSGGETKRLFTAFYTFFAAYHNMVTDALKRTGIKANEQGVLYATAYAANQFLWLILIPSLASAAVLDGFGDDEDEYWAKMTKVVAGYGFSGMVWFRDVASALSSDFGFSGPPIFRAVETAVDFIDNVGQGEVDKALVRSGLMTVGYFGHLPTRQLWRTVEALWDYEQGEMTASEAAANVAGFRHHKQ